MDTEGSLLGFYSLEKLAADLRKFLVGPTIAKDDPGYDTLGRKGG